MDGGDNCFTIEASLASLAPAEAAGAEAETPCIKSDLLSNKSQWLDLVLGPNFMAQANIKTGTNIFFYKIPYHTKCVSWPEIIFKQYKNLRETTGN
jgi:hypothetical protein